MQAEARNLAAAVRWYLAHDRAPLPHLFRVLWPLWGLRDHVAEARPWVEQLLPAAGSLDPQARAELVLAAALIAMDVGDDAAALAARQRLGPLLAGIEDPFLHAICQVAIAWASPITGDCDGALREVSASLEQLRGQDEPLWTTLAAYTVGVWRRPSAATTTLWAPARAAQPGGSLRLRLDCRLVRGAAGHPGRSCRPARPGPGAAG